MKLLVPLEGLIIPVTTFASEGRSVFCLPLLHYRHVDECVIPFCEERLVAFSLTRLEPVKNKASSAAREVHSWKSGDGVDARESKGRGVFGVESFSLRCRAFFNSS